MFAAFWLGVGFFVDTQVKPGHDGGVMVGVLRGGCGLLHIRSQ
jgi:hypothetical protein